MKYILLSMMVLSITSCNAKHTNKAAEGKRISIFDEKESFKNEQNYRYIPPSATNLSEWFYTDGAQTSNMTGNHMLRKISKFTSVKLNKGVRPNTTNIPTPLIVKDILYTQDMSGDIVAYSLTQGKKLWSVNLVDNLERKVIMGGGIYFAEPNLYCTWGGQEVIALEAKTGEEVWRTKLNSLIRSVPVVFGNEVFVKGIENTIFLLNRHTGNLLRMVEGVEEPVIRSNKLSIVKGGDDQILVISSLGKLEMVKNSTKEVLWSKEIGLINNVLTHQFVSNISSAPVVYNNIVYIATESSTLAALSAKTGHEIWYHPMNGIESLWIAGDGLFFIDGNDQLWHLNALNGNIRWSIELRPAKDNKNKSKRKAEKFYGPIMASGHLFVVSSAGRLLEFDPQNGKILVTHHIPKGKYSIPIIVQGRMYMMQHNGNLVISE